VAAEPGAVVGGGVVIGPPVTTAVDVAVVVVGAVPCTTNAGSVHCEQKPKRMELAMLISGPRVPWLQEAVMQLVRKEAAVVETMSERHMQL
jgi:hypothetical protein